MGGPGCGRSHRDWGGQSRLGPSRCADCTGAAGGVLAVLRTLADLTRGAVQRPRPRVSLTVENDVVDSVRVGYGRFRRLDIEAIVADEVRSARETLPRTQWVDMGWRDDEQTVRRSRQPDDPTWHHGWPVDADNWAAVVESGQGWRRRVERDERTVFAAEIERYARDLSEWLYDLEDERDERRRRLRLALRLQNTGREPALDVMLILRFPRGFQLVRERESLGPDPVRPRFEKGPQDAFMNLLELPPSKAIGDP